MIVDKTSGNVVSSNTTNSKHKTKVPSAEVTTSTELDEMPANSIINVHNAVKEILQGVRWKYNDKNSEKIFHYVKVNTGQYEAIVTGKTNPQNEIAFPAAFIHFINIRWTSTQNTINNGTAELRIQVILNTLNNTDDDKETEMYYVCQRVIQTLQEERYNYPSLIKQFKLEFMDTATSYHSGLQSCWLTYIVKFSEINIWRSRKTVQRYIVVPPFTNHSDQKDPDVQNPHRHQNSHHPRTYDQATDFDLEFED